MDPIHSINLCGYFDVPYNFVTDVNGFWSTTIDLLLCFQEELGLRSLNCSLLNNLPVGTKYCRR